MNTAQQQVNTFQDSLATLDQEIAVISESELSYVEYFRTFLEQIVSVLGNGGSVWKFADKQLSCVCHINQSIAGLEPNGAQFALAEKAILKVCESGDTIVLPANGSSDLFDGGLGQQAVNNSPHTLLFVPIKVAGEVSAILVLISPEGVDPRAVRGYAGFVLNLCQKASQFILAEDLRSQRKFTYKTDRLRQYVSALHSSLDPKRCGYALANYSQELLEVYRCTAGTFSPNGKFRVQAVSGLESVAVKSATLKDLETICREVCKNGKPIVVDNPHAAQKAETAGDDELLIAARLYMLQVDSVMMGVFPIKCPEGHVVGALIVEKALEEEFGKEQLQQIDGLLAEAGIAIRNCQQYRDLPMLAPMKLLASLRDKSFRSKRYKKIAWITVLLAIVILPHVIQKDIKVTGNSELISEGFRNIYASADGVIESVDIHQDRVVKAGQVLATFDTTVIENALADIANKIDENTIEYRQAISKGQGEKAKQLEYKIAGLRAQKAMNEYSLDQHKIKAPFDGIVTTRENEIRALANRPVKAGQVILEIIPENPNWELQVNVPEDEAGNLLDAWQNTPEGETLNAKIIMAAYPDEIFETEVLTIASRAHIENTGKQKYRNVISVTVAIPEKLKEMELRQGMEGKVAIECGTKSLFYAVTHEFTDFIRVNTFSWF